MNITEFKKAYPFMMKAGLTPLIWGDPGIGKTQMMKQIAKTLDLKFTYLTFSAVEDVGDVIGRLTEVMGDDGKPDHVKHLRPDWFPTQPGNLIVLDEVNRIPKTVMQTLLTFITEKKLHTHVLPADTHLVLIANPDNGDVIVEDISDRALMERVVHVHLDPTHKEFLEFAESSGTNYKVISFIQENPEMLETPPTKKFDFDFVVKNRRGWNDMAARFMDTNPPKELIFDVIKGISGTAAALRFMKHLDALDQKKFTVDDVLSKYDDKLKVLVKTASPDLINLTSDEIIRRVKLKQKVSNKEADGIVKFAIDIPIEMGYSFVNQLLRLGLEPVNKSVGENPELVALFTNKMNEIKQIQLNRK